MLRNQSGMTLVEVMIVAGIMTVSALAMLMMNANQMKATNHLEFQLKREQLRMVLLGQFLNDPNNCKCLFQGASPYPSSGAAQLGGTAPTAIGPYRFTTPGNCATATMPAPFVTTAGLDGLRATSITLNDVTPTSGVLTVAVQSMKETLGPAAVNPIRIPVAVQSTAAGGNQIFQSCAASGSGGGFAGGRCRLVLETWGNDDCTSGQYMRRYSDWTSAAAPGTILWTSRDAAGNPVAQYGGRNRASGDFACMRMGLECE